MATVDYTFELEGVKALRRKLNKLDDATRAKVLEDVVRDASEPVVRAAKGRAPSATIAEGIRVVNVVVEGSGKVKSEIGLPGGRHDWFYGLFVELGTGPRVQKTTGRRTGSMPARPFLRPAFDSERRAMQALFAQGIKRKLQAATRG